MSHERREVRYYQDRISQLEAENRKMKGSLHYTPTSKDLLTDTIYGTICILTQTSQPRINDCRGKQKSTKTKLKGVLLPLSGSLVSPMNAYSRRNICRLLTVLRLSSSTLPDDFLLFHHHLLKKSLKSINTKIKKLNEPRCLVPHNISIVPISTLPFSPHSLPTHCSQTQLSKWFLFFSLAKVK